MDSLTRKTYYEKNAISYLQDEYEPMQRALIVADPGMVQFGFVDTVLAQLALRDEKSQHQFTEQSNQTQLLDKQSKLQNKCVISNQIQSLQLVVALLLMHLNCTFNL